MPGSEHVNVGVARAHERPGGRVQRAPAESHEPQLHGDEQEQQRGQRPPGAPCALGDRRVLAGARRPRSARAEYTADATATSDSITSDDAQAERVGEGGKPEQVEADVAAEDRIGGADGGAVERLQ